MTKITLFETLAIKGGQVVNLPYHHARFNKGQIFLNRQNIIDDITTLIDVPSHFDTDKPIRVRVTYDADEVWVEYFDYTPKRIRSFKMVECDDIDYQYKYHDRALLNQLFLQKDTCDEIVIIKNSFVSDCSIGNLLFLKDGIWYTPDTPLLQGTQRAYLLDIKKIHLASIRQQDIYQYEKVMMINALNGFDDSRAISTTQIRQ